MEEDWDTLVILDACRVDELRRVNPFDSPVETRTSPTSFTVGFYKAIFEGQTFADTVVVSANPHVVDFDAQFASVYHVWETHWNEEYTTVLPEDVTDVAIEVHQRHPDKRIFVHYMQPHSPYIGPTGRQIQTRGAVGGGIQREDGAASQLTVGQQLRDGSLPLGLFKRAYRENLKIAVEECQRLRDSVNGKLVVSADHGEAFGEGGHFTHPRWTHIPELITVPWLELDGSRRQIRPARETVSVKETPSEPTDHQEESAIQEKLAALGYRE